MLNLKGETSSKLIKNFSWLSFLHISNYLFPLITVPYVVRILGVENYGLANFAIAFSLYFVTISDYGFNLSATREIALHKNDQNELNVIFNSVLFIKIFLFIISIIIFLLLATKVDLFRRHFFLYIIAISGVLGNVLFPSWFFQGIEKMNLITFFSIAIKILFVISIFIFVTNKNDIDIYLIVNSASSIIMGFITVLYAYYRLGIKFLIPTKIAIIKQLKEGYHLFISSVSINLYTSSNTFLLGILAGNQAVGLFTGANKIREAYQGLIANFGRTFYPHITQQFQINKQIAFNQIKKFSRIVLTLSFGSGLILFIFSKEIVLIVLGNEFMEAISLLRIMAFVPAVITISNIYGIQMMLNLGYKKQFNRIILFAAIVNFIFMFSLVPLIGAEGAAISTLGTEVFVSSAMFLFIYNKLKSKRKIV